jgi:hypothetical protein
MARVPAGLPAGIRLTDHISLGVIARTFPLEEVRRVLAETGRASERQRDLPAQVMVYYAIALALYAGAGTREVLRCLLEGLRWLWGAEAVRVAGKSGISQARTRLGEAPLRRLYERWCGPCDARHQGRLVPAVAAGQPGRLLPRRRRHRENRAAFGRPRRAAARAPSRSSASWPWSRTARTCCSAPAGPLRGRRDDAGPCGAAGAPAGMLCLADRQFFGHALWQEAAATAPTCSGG